jgi:hypothetical protein
MLVLPAVFSLSFLSNYRCKSMDINCVTFDEAKLRCLKCATSLSAYGIGCR